MALLEEQNLAREVDLIPVRHGRMAVSAFTFYRGAAKIMADDLAATPNAGLTVQLCGDAHLSNFGVFASPERTLLFDINDFDETLPGPFEYDVKRLAASLTIAGRNNGFEESDSDRASYQAAASYADAMRDFAGRRMLDIWYARLSEVELMEAIQRVAGDRRAGRAQKLLDKARTRDSIQALAKLGEIIDGMPRIVSDPPIVTPIREWSTTKGMRPEEVRAGVDRLLDAYRATLPSDRADLLDRFEVVDIARKVVGVGSVGTRAFIVLLTGRDAQDPLFLQVKEATRSVLEGHLPASRFDQPGERVVHGQRLMQAASDLFLGWSPGVEQDRFYYWRQLRDRKGSADPEAMDPKAMRFYAGMCGWTHRPPGPTTRMEKMATRKTTKRARPGTALDRDLERAYSPKQFAAKLRRLADAIESGQGFTIQVAGESLRIPAGATFNIEHERAGGEEELEFQLRWRPGAR